MKKPKILKHTNIFQSMIENYRKSTNKILAEKRSKISLNSHLLNDLYEVKNKENFSDADYLINEIKLQNHLKDEMNFSHQKRSKNSKILKNKEYTDKITKDIFFYYKYQINGRNNNNLDNNKQINNDLKNERVSSPKNSRHSINSAKRSCKSYRKSIDENLILPLINADYYKYKTPNKKNIYEEDNSENDKSRQNDRIIQSSRKRKANYLNYENNNFNTINVEHLLKNMKSNKNKLFFKLKLPLLKNNIFTKISEVKNISNDISRNINHFSTEGKTIIENGKNRIKFMNNLMT